MTKTTKSTFELDQEDLEEAVRAWLKNDHELSYNADVEYTFTGSKPGQFTCLVEATEED